MNTKMEKRYGGGRGQKRSGWLKQFLQPGWIITVVLVVAFSYLAFSTLAPWQLNKDDAIVARNEQIQAAYENDPVPVTEVLGAGGSIEAGDEWTRVVLEGRYLPQDEVLLRMRPVEQSPAFQSLVPFELTSGEQILVHRGWRPSSDGTTVPEIDPVPTGTVSLVGMLRQGESTATRAPLEESGYQQVYSISTEQISELTDTDLGEDYVQLSEDQPGVLYAMPVPQLERGSHLSYGLQWLAFGVMAPLGLIYFVYAEVKERRKVRQEQGELADDPTTASVAADGDEDGDEEVDDLWLADDLDGRTHHVVRSRRVRDRYGDSKPDFYARLGRRERERF